MIPVGAIGSDTSLASTATNVTNRIKDEHGHTRVMADFQEWLLPQSRPNKRVNTAKMSTGAPKKSTRLSFTIKFELLLCGTLRSIKTTAKATTIRGTWSRKILAAIKGQRKIWVVWGCRRACLPSPANAVHEDSTHVRANHGPRFEYDVDISLPSPLSRIVATSDSKMATTVVKPPPPIPARPLATMSSVMLLARPHNKQPMLNTA
jgi:hypothetical protein